MALKEKIDAGIKAAMIAKDKVRLETLRSIKSMILLEETKEGAQGGLAEADEIALLTRAAKQRRESISIYQNQNREDLAETEIAQLTVIEEFLPQQLSAEELENEVSQIITEVGAASPADMGKVMGVASKKLAGRAEGKLISETVKKLLAK